MDGYALLLNGDYAPISVVRLPRAVVLVLSEKAEVLEQNDQVLVRSARTEFPAPLVIRLRYTVKIPTRTRLPVTRRNVVSRDKGVCAYRDQPRPKGAPKCDRVANTVDHVLPRARGGRHSWENVVASCQPCNSWKDDRTLEQIGWRIDRSTITVPTRSLWLGIGRIIEQPAEWAPYLGRMATA